MPLPETIGGLFDAPEVPAEEVIEETPAAEAPATEVEAAPKSLFPEEPKEAPAYGKRVEREMAKLRRSARDAERELETVRKANEGLSQAAQAAAALVAPLRALYPEDRFKDPVAQLTFDAKYVEAFEKLVVEKDPSAVALNTKIMAALESATGGSRTVSTNQKPEVKEEAPKSDARVDALLEKTARREVSGLLKELGLKPSIASVFEDYVVGNLESLEDVRPEQVMEVAQAFIRERKFTEEDIMVPEMRSKKAKERPATAARAAAPAPATKVKKESNTPEKAESIMDRRRRILEETLENFPQE